jgi:regulatory protein
VEDFALFAGLELSDEQAEKLRTAAGQMSAKMRAVRIVTASAVSKKDLQQRLIRKGEDPRQAAEAVQWMADLDLVDDEKTARQIVNRCASKGYGIERARQALYEKRIPKEFWKDALADYPDQNEHIIKFLQSRLGSSWEDRDLKRAVDALLRRGHSYRDVQHALRQLDADDSWEE